MNENTLLTQTNCTHLFPHPKKYHKISIFFQTPMSNVTKNHVKIDIFKEPKHHLNLNQVYGRPFLPHKNQ